MFADEVWWFLNTHVFTVVWTAFVQWTLNTSPPSDVCETGRTRLSVCIAVIFPQSCNVCQCFCRGSGN